MSKHELNYGSAALPYLREKLEELEAELNVISARVRQRMRDDSRIKLGNHEADCTSSTPDFDLSRNIPSLQKQIDKMKEVIAKTERTGQYGICEECEEQIPLGRLKAVSFAKHCVQCANELASRNDKHYSSITRSRDLLFI